jgi:hypothetical protein
MLEGWEAYKIEAECLKRKNTLGRRQIGSSQFLPAVAHASAFVKTSARQDCEASGKLRSK